MTANPADGTIVAGRHLAPEILRSLREASHRTGVDFDFLVAQASLESGFTADVRSKSSSAAGLFQFTSATWLESMKEHGAKYGHADAAHAITKLANGHYAVADPDKEKQILDLRKDVRLAALMAAEYAKRNAARLQHAVGHKASPAELHLAHLLGPAGAIRFLKAHDRDGAQDAAAVLPAAARENPELFYAHGSGTPQSVAAVYRKIQQRLAVPMKQMAALDHEQLRPALGLSGAAPKTRGDRRA